VRYLIIPILFLTGCKSLPYLEDARIGLTGIDLRFQEVKTMKVEEAGWFGEFNSITNRATPVSFPVLMEMDKK
jgi:hypothetical protein